MASYTGFTSASPSIHTTSNQVRGIREVGDRYEVLLDAPRAHEPVEDAHATSLVVCAAGTRASEGLLPDDGTRAFLVVVHISGGVAEAFGGRDECTPVAREAA